MSRHPHVVALCGSLREESKTRVALREALAAAEAAGAETTLVDLREYDLPHLDPDEGDVGDAAALRETVDAADAVLLGTPNYHGSFSGSLKNALDYLGRDEFGGKTVGLLVVAGGSFPTKALEHLRTVCRTIDAWTLPTEVAIPNAYSAVRGGDIADEDVRERVRTLGTELVDYAGLDDYPDVAPDPAGPVSDD